MLFALSLLLFTNPQTHKQPAQRFSLQSTALLGRKALRPLRCRLRLGPARGDGELPAPARGRRLSFREKSSPVTATLKVITAQFL